MVESFVIGQINYCFEVYSLLRLQKIIRTKIQKLVNSAARLVLEIESFANCKIMIRYLKWLNMNNNYR